MSEKIGINSSYSQIFDVPKYNKITFGEVSTDFKLCQKIIDLIPIKQFQEPDRKWLDPCCGRGYFMIVLYNKLFKCLEFCLPDTKLRHRHIIENMLYMVELNTNLIPELHKIFGNNANIYNENFLTFDNNEKYDFVIGNPPFNVGGIVKVPTNKIVDKRGDGKSIWKQFVLKSLDLLKGRGFMSMITPSIWMKRDHPVNPILRQYKIRKLHTLTGNKTNEIFHGHAQTPTCYFCLRKIRSNKFPSINKNITIFDNSIKKYVEICIENTDSVPLNCVSVMKKMQHKLLQYGPIILKKTNMPHPSINLSNTQSENYPHPNIKSCVLQDKVHPTLSINYSNRECPFAHKPKLVLAHKMYGFPYYDVSGEYGISNRDNYVIYDRTDRDYKILKAFLSSKFAYYLYEATRYRMKYLEKYVYEMIPDISKDCDIYHDYIDDEWIFNYFELDEIERFAILNQTKRNYLPFSCP